MRALRLFTVGPHDHTRVSPPMTLDAGPMTGLKRIKRDRYRHRCQ
jgi:hypothetical protein